MEEKRKTHTSYEVKKRYETKTYDKFMLRVHKETAAQYKAKCEKLGISYSEPLHNAIKAFLEE